MTDPAHILFPSDAPASSQPPEYFKVQQNAATARLMGGQKPATDDAAARMFPNNAAKSGTLPAPSAGLTDPAQTDAAATLFKDDATSQFDEKPIAGFFNTFALSARSDGDVERAEALSSAGEALIADARAAGMDAAELTSALDIVSERQGDTLSPIAPEKIEAEFASGMAAIQQEFGDTYMADLSAARAFIRDLEIIAPGTIDSLERTGAGNDMRLIRSAIKEAKRRGYR
ncbi:hypothetical protein [Nitrobacter sp. TKz-YC02]|uniref:hypothetical protein n=1 Tax=Nitrobacter sp. TKz-YC02 TaxID=3398704 RepID=UPI003CF3AD0D